MRFDIAKIPDLRQQDVAWNAMKAGLVRPIINAMGDTITVIVADDGLDADAVQRFNDYMRTDPIPADAPHRKYEARLAWIESQIDDLQAILQIPPPSATLTLSQAGIVVRGHDIQIKRLIRLVLILLADKIERAGPS